MKVKACRSRIGISHSRWLAYAAASAATALTGGQSVEAAIHYSGVINAVFRPDETRRVSFQLDRPDNLLAFEHVANASVAAFRALDGSFRIYLPGYDFYVDNLAFGQRVSAATRLYWYRSGHIKNHFGIMAWYSYRTVAQFLSPGIGYLGFRFDSGRGLQYGWARVKMAGVRKKNAFKLIDYAYADPGEAITAGQTSSDEPGSEEGSLGWLALGAVGLMTWRQRRWKAAKV